MITAKIGYDAGVLLTTDWWSSGSGQQDESRPFEFCQKKHGEAESRW